MNREDDELIERLNNGGTLTVEDLGLDWDLLNRNLTEKEKKEYCESRGLIYGY